VCTVLLHHHDALLQQVLLEHLALKLSGHGLVRDVSAVETTVSEFSPPKNLPFKHSIPNGQE
jgi:hypothetical protein